MDRYRDFILTAKTMNTKSKPSSNSSGFGAPKRDKTEPATKEEIARWRARSEGYRKQYLDKHPNSKFKDVAARGSIVTRSKKLSNKPEAKEMVFRGAEFLAGLGLRSGPINKEGAHKTIKHVRDFLRTKDREPFVSKAMDMFKRYHSKLSKKDQNDIDTEAKDIMNNPRERPSKVLHRKDRKGKLPAILGAVMFGALFGSLLFISPEIAMYLGVKALDLAVESARATVSEPVSAFLAAHTISSFFKSKDSDEYVEDTERKIARRYDPENELDKADEEPTQDETTDEKSPDAVKSAVEKQLGPNFDSSKYELDEAGNLKRKK